jgi:hypothetical protein
MRTLNAELYVAYLSGSIFASYTFLGKQHYFSTFDDVVIISYHLVHLLFDSVQ